MQGRLNAFKQKETFLYLLAILSIGLVFLPIVTTFNDLLTRLVMRLDIYRFIQNVILPFEIKMVALVLRVFALSASASPEYLVIGGAQNPFLVEIAWNCIGWQSLVFFLLSVWIGLQGEYSVISKIKAFIIGFFGTFLVNIFRLAMMGILAVHLKQSTLLVIHDYSSVILMIGWLIFFWWFSYAFVLREQR